MDNLTNLFTSIADMDKKEKVKAVKFLQELRQLKSLSNQFREVLYALNCILIDEAI